MGGHATMSSMLASVICSKQIPTALQVLSLYYKLPCHTKKYLWPIRKPQIIINTSGRQVLKHVQLNKSQTSIIPDWVLFLACFFTQPLFVALHAKCYDPSFKNLVVVGVWSWSLNFEPWDTICCEKMKYSPQIFSKSCTKLLYKSRTLILFSHGPLAKQGVVGKVPHFSRESGHL